MKKYILVGLSLSLASNVYAAAAERDAGDARAVVSVAGTACAPTELELQTLLTKTLEKQNKKPAGFPDADFWERHRLAAAVLAGIPKAEQRYLVASCTAEIFQDVFIVDLANVLIQMNGHFEKYGSMPFTWTAQLSQGLTYDAETHINYVYQLMGMLATDTMKPYLSLINEHIPALAERLTPEQDVPTRLGIITHALDGIIHIAAGELPSLGDGTATAYAGTPRIYGAGAPTEAEGAPAEAAAAPAPRAHGGAGGGSGASASPYGGETETVEPATRDAEDMAHGAIIRTAYSPESQRELDEAHAAFYNVKGEAEAVRTAYDIIIRTSSDTSVARTPAANAAIARAVEATRARLEAATAALEAVQARVDAIHADILRHQRAEAEAAAARSRDVRDAAASRMAAARTEGATTVQPRIYGAGAPAAGAHAVMTPAAGSTADSFEALFEAAQHAREMASIAESEGDAAGQARWAAEAAKLEARLSSF